VAGSADDALRRDAGLTSAMDILRFGPGHRHLGGPPGTKNVEGTVIMSDDRAVVSELAFGRYAMVVPHENPDNTALFVVISGAGWVQVGDERARINHGEAVVWPPAIPHGAYTDGTEMRAIVIELTGGDGHLIEGIAHAALTDPAEPEPAADAADASPGPPSGRAAGSLAERQVTRDEYDSSEGEPW
jgi:quercetin dioxygenase-like cupin family protein